MIEGIEHLAVCDRTHGGSSNNNAHVYGHEASARTCIRLLGTGTWVYDPRWEKQPYWVFIDRASYPYRGNDKDVYVGPFDTDKDAAHAMDHALLIDHLMQREGGGGTDCYVTLEHPGEHDDVHIIDPTDPDHTGRS